MTRLLLAALAAAAAIVALAWASARDLRQPWTVPPMPDPDDDMAGVQVDVRPLEVVVSGTRRGFSNGYETVWTHDPLRDYWPVPTTQTGPLGPAA